MKALTISKNTEIQKDFHFTEIDICFEIVSSRIQILKVAFYKKLSPQQMVTIPKILLKTSLIVFIGKSQYFFL